MHFAALTAIATVATVIATATGSIYGKLERGTPSDLPAAALTGVGDNDPSAARYWSGWLLEVPQPRTVTAAGDAIGALMWMQGEESPHQILDIVWGVSASGRLVNALLRTADRAGNIYTYDRLHAYERLLFSLDEIDQVTIHAGADRNPVQVHQLRYQVGENGFLGLQYVAGQGSDGVAFTFGDPHHLFADCCGPKTITSCVTNPDDPCQAGSCPGPANCTCTGTSGSCELVTGYECSGNCGSLHGCQGTNTSTCLPNDGTNPLTCSCREAKG